MSEITYQEETSLSLPSTPETALAAAAVAQAFLEDQQVEEGQPVVGVPMTVPSSPPPTSPDSLVAAPVDEPEPFDLAMFEPQLTPELAELLEDEPPDFDAEARAEVQAELQAAEDTGTYFEGDPDLSAKLRAAEKRNQFLEDRLAQSSRGKWVQENLRSYPLVAQFAKDELDQIQATSRRGFAREAAALNERLARMAKPLLEYQAKRVGEASEQAQTEQRERVNQAWGTPAADLAATGATAEQLQRIQAARKGEDLAGVIKAMIEPNPSSVL